MTAGAWATALLLDDVERGEGRRRAVEELLRPEYQRESLPERALRTVQDFINGLLDQVGGGVPGGVLALALVIIILAVLIALVAWYARRATGARRARGTGGLFGTGQRTAAEHRRAAEEAAAHARWAEAVRERLRAIARDLEHRAIVAPQPGRTADELARAAGRELPDLAARLSAAARLFDDVTYGQAPGTEEDYRFMSELDEALGAARPAAVAAGGAG
ncbi:hypothetical protein Sru01_03620 [Sphaerisporangium rufum]|uniref:Protein-glutamine gamma-glutamyltransferase-like C-terminal domain-containing protein n=1 Tax=Sphaerisporangium rufum TaxID=1381558 RepID=A0A919R1L9_9ACTN|nr:DUF4129 domain-containing protein [Sphaerisporangium rufum]GII75380.1 hypothetical protein Sru01_03620 [Sphaerisporangium rufum]